MPSEVELFERLAALETELKALKSAAPPVVNPIDQVRQQEEFQRQALRLSVSMPVRTHTMAATMQPIQASVGVARRALAVYRVRSGYWPDPQRLTSEEAAILQRDAKALASAQPLADWPPSTPTGAVFVQLQRESRQLTISLEQAEPLLAQLLKHIPWALRSFWEQRYGPLRSGTGK